MKETESKSIREALSLRLKFTHGDQKCWQDQELRNYILDEVQKTFGPTERDWSERTVDAIYRSDLQTKQEIDKCVAEHLTTLCGNYDPNLYGLQKGWDPSRIIEFLSWMFKREYWYVNSNANHWFGIMVGPNINVPSVVREAWRPRFEFEGSFGCVRKVKVNGCFGAKITSQGYTNFRNDFDPIAVHLLGKRESERLRTAVAKNHYYENQIENTSIKVFQASERGDYTAEYVISAVFERPASLSQNSSTLSQQSQS